VGLLKSNDPSQMPSLQSEGGVAVLSLQSATCWDLKTCRAAKTQDGTAGKQKKT